MAKKISAQISTLAYPASIALVLLAFFTISGNFILNRITTARSDTARLKKEENLLLQKLNTLQQTQDEALSTEQVLYALPSKNPSLMASSQIKNLASSQNLIVESVQIGNASESKDGGFYTDISVDISGPYPNMISLLNTVSTLAPIMTINKVQFTGNLNPTRTTLIVTTYWYPLPENLPAINKSIGGLDNEDQQILTKLLNLSPAFFSDLQPQDANLSENPFEF